MQKKSNRWWWAVVVAALLCTGLMVQAKTATLPDNLTHGQIPAIQAMMPTHGQPSDLAPAKVPHAAPDMTGDLQKGVPADIKALFSTRTDPFTLTTVISPRSMSC